MDPDPIRLVTLEEETRTQTCTEGPPREDTGEDFKPRREASGEPAPPTPGSQAPSLPDAERTHFCGWSHLPCGIYLLRWPSYERRSHTDHHRSEHLQSPPSGPGLHSGFPHCPSVGPGQQVLWVFSGTGKLSEAQRGSLLTQGHTAGLMTPSPLSEPLSAHSLRATLRFIFGARSPED